MCRVKCTGFAIFEVMLAIVVMTLASVGAFALYHSASQANRMSAIVTETVMLKSIFMHLYEADLTTDLNKPDDLVNALHSSKQLPASFFSYDKKQNILTLVNPNGVITLSNVSSNKFDATIPFPKHTKDDKLTSFCKRISRYVANCNPNDNNVLITITVTDSDDY